MHLYSFIVRVSEILTKDCPLTLLRARMGKGDVALALERSLMKTRQDKVFSEIWPDFTLILLQPVVQGVGLKPLKELSMTQPVSRSMGIDPCFVGSSFHQCPTLRHSPLHCPL